MLILEQGKESHYQVVGHNRVGADEPEQLTAAHEHQVIATLTSAFITDPPVRWLYPDTSSYLEHFPDFAKAFGGAALPLGNAWGVADLSAVSLWFSPGTGPDEEMLMEVIDSSISPRRKSEVSALFESMGELHPEEPHWYLPLIGTDPLHQGHGYGANLMSTALAVCDQQQMPAYLEATNPRTIPFYQRFGFEVRAEIQCGECPSIVTMWRAPQSAPT